METQNELQMRRIARAIAWLAWLLPLAVLLSYVLLWGENITAGLVLTAVYMILAPILSALRRAYSNRKPNDPSEQIQPNISLELLSRMHLPILICNRAGETVWFNRAFWSRVQATLPEGEMPKPFYGRSAEALTGMSISGVMDSPSGLEGDAFGGAYFATGYTVTAKDQTYSMIVWEDRTELRDVYRQLAEEKMILAYIVIDNTDELLQFVQEQYRQVSVQVGQILYRWAESVGGILKEYERDKFLFLFEARHLDAFVQDKFGILDEVRMIQNQEERLPVTLSIGVAKVEGTLIDKERTAQEALDMALQRGGDQAVVKAADRMDFYGGRSKTAQRRTKVRARVVANQLMRLMSASKNVIIMGHRNPDFDSIGACVAIAKLARYAGKNTYIAINKSDHNLRKCYDRLRGIEGYHNLFVNTREAQDLLRAETLLVICDVNNYKQFESPELAAAAHRVVIIDHHRKTEEFKTQPEVSYIEPSASSACELTTELLEQILPTGALEKEEADIILSGILLDTKQFSRNTGVRTFGAALFLRNEGANPVDTQELFKTDLEGLRREARFESGVELYRGMIAIAADETDADANSGEARIAAAKAADKFLTIERVQAAFVLIRLGDAVHISARSAGEINVQLILERLGGGGYFDAAATRLDGSVTEAKERLIGAIDAYLNEQ